MRFEEPVNRLVARYPELRVYERERANPHARHHEIAAGIAAGRRLHAAFCRRAAAAVIIAPVLAGARFFRRSATSVVRSFKADLNRRSTVQVLGAIDDRLLRDIGIDRGDIPYVAASLAMPGRQRKPAADSPSEPAPSGEIFVPARAA